MRKVFLLFLLSVFCLVPVYAQMGLPGVPDPLNPGEIMLSRTDLRFKGNAEMALAKGDINSAVMALNNIRLDWARHWLLSYAYEQVRDYEKALGEVNWLLKQNPREDLAYGIRNREAILGNMVKTQNQGKDMPEGPGTKAFLHWK